VAHSRVEHTEHEPWMAATLSDLEQKILDYMVQYLRSNTYQPSIREIGERFGIKSTKTVSEHLQALADKGFLERDPSRSRGVRILGVDLSGDTVTVPCYRSLPGEPGEPLGPAETSYSIDRRIGGAKGSYFVRARGDELAALGVGEGDLVLIEPTDPAALAQGDVVAARTGSSPGFHQVSRNGRGMSLRPLAGGEPVFVEDPSSLVVLGRATAVIRRLEGEVARVSLTAH
jgi:repressor LexA